VTRRVSPRLLLVLIVVAGAYLRIRGLDWGLPWPLHIDERLFVAEKTMALEKSLSEGGLPQAGITSYGILPLWLVAALRAIFLDGVMRPGSPTYGNELAATILLARIASCAAGIALIFVTFLWARRFSPTVGLVAAAFVAGFPSLVQASHFGTVESLLLLLIAAGMWTAERLAEGSGRARTVVAGLVWGAALSVKLPALLLAFPLFWAAGKRRFVQLALVAAVVVVALNPALVVNLFRGHDAQAVPEHATVEGNLRRAYSGDFHDWTLPYAKDRPLIPELTRMLPYGAGIFPEILALVGLVIALRRRNGPDVRLLLFVVPFLFTILPLRAHTIRFLLPVFPALAVLAAIGARSIPLPGVSLVAVVVTALHGLAFSTIYTRKDPRIMAAEWIEHTVLPRETVLIEDPPGYGPPIGSPAPSIPRRPVRTEILWRNFYSVHERRTEEERRAHIQEMLDQANILVLSEGHRIEFTKAGDLRPAEKELYQKLDSGQLPFRRVARYRNEPRLGPFEFSDRGAETLMRVFDHPRIEIWRRIPYPAPE
jgi:4-amino-4-deoxy-L-arabinose transferase-like glycosyltransferase